MANITKKVSWSSRGDESGGGERSPLLNGSEEVRYTRQLSGDGGMFHIGRLSTVDLEEDMTSEEVTLRFLSM
uniref:Uncharacterized protein n=1 Tax=Hucho hucho TaxID=62062 RepID=A0A4W5JME0_9TELE